jgi:hypothetical protein
LRAGFFVHVEKTKIMLGAEVKFLIGLLKPKFYNFISHLPKWLFMIFS